MTEMIGGRVFGHMIRCASAALNENCELINKLNVFPVPDGDTGTNMSLTLSAAAGAMEQNTPERLDEAAEKVASLMLRGARGNSGVILSLLFRGFAKGVHGNRECDALILASAMLDGVDAAYKAVMKPAEGTILTVSRRAAEMACESAAAGADAELMLETALQTAEEALAGTTEQNPVLKKAGVVDAGGKGYCVILRAMLDALRGKFTAKESAPLRSEADFSSIEDEEITFTYCTEFIVARENERDPKLIRAFLESIGDSLVFVEDEEIIKVHVHTDRPGDVLSEALHYGALRTVKVENMRIQHTTLAQSVAVQNAAPAEKEIGFVAVCAGEGLTELFRELGVDRVVTGGQTMNPSTEDILREIEQVNAETVFVFPNNKNIVLAAEQCAALTEKKLVIVPTHTVPQGVSALAARDDSASVEEQYDAFCACIERVHTALVTYAARDSEFDGHSIRAGEYLALLDGALLGSYTDQYALFEELKRALAGTEPEFITVFYGADVKSEAAEAVEGAFSAAFPEADVSLVDGGQPVYYYMISAE